MRYTANEGIKTPFLKVYKKNHYNIEKYGGEMGRTLVVFQFIKGRGIDGLAIFRLC